MTWVAPSEKDHDNETLEKRLWATADQLRANSGLTSQQYFTPPSEELQRLAEEISLLRRDFQAGMAALGRIEKRLKANFPAYAPKKQMRTPSSSSGSRTLSTKSRDDLMTDFDSLIAATKEKGDVGFESFLSALPEEDVIALAYELGVGSPKTSIKRAREGIRARIQESLLLSFENKKDTQQ